MSKRSSASARPDLLVDRSLGGIAVPAALRSLGFTVLTLDDVFGRRPVEDVEWMRRADIEGWAVACKDDRIRTRPAERDAFAETTLRVLCLTNGNLRRDEMARRFIDNVASIDRLWHESGPWMFGVYASGVRRLRLYPHSADG